MARIALAWELGRSYGHAVSCAGLARSLHARGHTIAFFFRELRQLDILPEAAAYDVFQAPWCRHEGMNESIPASFSDVLLGCGYRSAAELAGLLGGWRTLITQWRPHLVVTDYAPTALLAAQSLGVARATYGNGFFTPPRLDPLPPFRYDAPVDPAALARADALALAAVNSALARFGAKPLARLADMFVTDEDFLCTFPELDHYGTRPASGYWGPRMRLDMGADVAWPQGAGPRVFLYVQKYMPAMDALIDSLAAGPYRLLAFVPDLEPARRARLAGRGRVVLERPVRMDTVLRECDLLVCLGGEIAHGSLMRGVPVLFFPLHYEQYLTARRTEQLGAGVSMRLRAQRAEIDAALSAMTRDTRYRAAAQAFARRYPAYSPGEQRRRIVQRIEAILSPSPTTPGTPR